MWSVAKDIKNLIFLVGNLPFTNYSQWHRDSLCDKGCSRKTGANAHTQGYRKIKGLLLSWIYLIQTPTSMSNCVYYFIYLFIYVQECTQVSSHKAQRSYNQHWGDLWRWREQREQDGKNTQEKWKTDYQSSGKKTSAERETETTLTSFNEINKQSYLHHPLLVTQNWRGDLLFNRCLCDK